MHDLGQIDTIQADQDSGQTQFWPIVHDSDLSRWQGPGGVGEQSELTAGGLASCRRSRRIASFTNKNFEKSKIATIS